MRKRVEFRAAARIEFREAISWYNEQRMGLGWEFEEEIYKTLDRVCDSPETYSVAIRDTRRVLVHRFPYVIYYRVESERIVVIAVYHGHRDQDAVTERT